MLANNLKHHEILDCTLRDGGYYTNWNFTKQFVTDYCRAINGLNIKKIEIGYINPKSRLGYGVFFNFPNQSLDHIKKNLNEGVEVGLMINFKDIIDLPTFDYLMPIIGKVDFIRLAIDPDETQNLSTIVRKIKDYGFKCYANIMYMHKYINEGLPPSVEKEISVADGINFVDSYGCCMPDQVSNFFKKYSQKGYNTGFHGHDNMGLASANSIAAIIAGSTNIDVTFSGMGRGAGNTATEDWMVITSNLKDIQNEDVLHFIECMQNLKNKLCWGKNFTYSIAAAHQLPQSSVMSLLALRRFSLPELINNLRDKTLANPQAPHFKKLSDAKALILGGGESSTFFLDWANFKKLCDIELIFISSRILHNFLKQIQNNRILGQLKLTFLGSASEIAKLKEEQSNISNHKITFIESNLSQFNYESIGTSLTMKSPLLTIIDAAKHNKLKVIYCVGLDGYKGSDMRHIETKAIISSTNIFLALNKNDYGIPVIKQDKLSEIFM